MITVISQVQLACWELVFAKRDEQNQLANVNLAREQLRMIEEQVSVGTSANSRSSPGIDSDRFGRNRLCYTSIQAVTTAENVLKQLVLRNRNAQRMVQSFKANGRAVISPDAHQSKGRSR